MTHQAKVVALHAGVLLALFVAQFLASDYVLLSLTRIMVLGVYAMGYNVLFGYTGLLSLGHAMFFGVGLYTAALSVTKLGLSPPAAFVISLITGFIASWCVGLIALRARGVGFMIVTLMFSQAAYLTILYFGDITRGDEGIVIKDTLRQFELAGFTVDLTNATLRYNLALALLAITTLLVLLIVRSSMGRTLIAIRENETRTTMLGYDVERYRLAALVASGTIAAAAGAAYALLFAYAGASLASIQYSIHPLLWTLLGGASTVLGPLLGTALMTVLVDLASSLTDANLLAVGLVLIATVLFFPKGILGTLRQKFWSWLP